MRFLFDPVFYFYMFWIPQYLNRERGASLEDIGRLTWIPFLVLGISSVIGGAVSDRLVRRGFSIAEGERVLIAEDIVTTGLSFRETVEALQKLPGEVVGGACIIDRSGGRADVGCELVSLAAVDFPDYDADDLPPELAAMPAVKPGSRGLA